MKLNDRRVSTQSFKHCSPKCNKTVNTGFYSTNHQQMCILFKSLSGLALCFYLKTSTAQTRLLVATLQTTKGTTTVYPISNHFLVWLFIFI